MKTCPGCGEDRPLDQYRKARRSKDGLQWWCKECQRAAEQRSYVKKQYGITLDEYRALKESGCAVCGSHHRLAIDHCHTTGRVRGVLCMGCNIAVGQAGDDPERLRSLAEYLESA